MKQHKVKHKMAMDAIGLAACQSEPPARRNAERIQVAVESVVIAYCLLGWGVFLGWVLASWTGCGA